MSLILNSFVRLKKSKKLGQFFNGSMTKLNPDNTIPRTIWIYWDQGIEAAPEVVRVCVARWRVLHPNWTVHFLDSKTYSEFAKLAPIEDTYLPASAWANMLRMELLLEHGGVWADATVYPACALDTWLPYVSRAGFFSFSRPGKDRMISNWFIAAASGHPVIANWSHASWEYWTARTKRSAYFWHHYTFEFLFRTKPAFRHAIRDMPRLPADNAQSVRKYLLAAQLNTDAPLPDASLSPVQKLTWKEPIDMRLAASIIDGCDQGIEDA